MPISRSSVGVTLVELLVTMTILAILLATAPGALGWMVGKTAVATAANELRGAIGWARTTAVTRAETIAICPGTTEGCDPFDDWNLGWIAFRDLDADGVRDDGEDVLRVWAAPRARVTVLSTAGFVRFERMGSAGRTEHWRICRDDMPPRGIVMWATGATNGIEPESCDLPLLQ
jgi:type IV fimbrial biogenesis protein FimT